MTIDEKIIALENAEAAVEAARTAIVTMSGADDKAILQGTAHNHPTRPEIWANITGAVEILKRID